jgi:hypothetical protein
MENKSHNTVSPAELQAIGSGFLAYVKPLDAEDASKLLGQDVEVPAGQHLYGLFNANGAPISISQSFEAAAGNAMEHELVPLRVH